MASGGYIGWKTSSPPEKTFSPDSQPARQTAGERNPVRGNTASRETALRMKTVRDAPTQAERIRAAISLAMSLPASEFAAWAEGDRFDFRAGPELSIFRMILFERWIAEDPDSLIAFSVNNNHGQAYRGVAQLAKEDPQRVIDFFRENPNDAFELEKLAEIGSHGPALALSRLEEMSARGLTAADTERSGALFRALAMKSPEVLEAALAGLSPALRKQAETALIGKRLKESFQAEVRALWDRPDGWEMFNEIIQRNRKLGTEIAGEVMNMPAAWRSSLADFPYYAVQSGSAKQWLDMDLAAAGFSKSQEERIRKFAIQQLASAEPEEAISRLDSLGLSAEERAGILSNAFSRYGKSPEKAEKLIAMLSSAEEKAEARKLLELTVLGTGKNGSKTPSDWLKALDGAKGTGNASWYFARETGRWDAGQVSEFQKGFQELSAEGKQKVAGELASRAESSDGNDSVIGHAVKYLVENPPEKTESRNFQDNPTNNAAAFAMRLASNDLSAASTWIDSLPQGEAKTWARRNVAMDMRQYDPAAVREWITTLPQGERDDLNKYLADGE